ncbi:MAG TPA: hypothetical protein VN255_13560 [Mycobacterium sp.]|nr:hypothetical protein [Mycobacterium sp.]HWT49550.1 hypothetical protein [Mycobacterium sp.]
MTDRTMYQVIRRTGGAAQQAALDILNPGLPGSQFAPQPRPLPRHGFDDLGEPVQLPDGPRVWPMWRQPQEQTR